MGGGSHNPQIIRCPMLPANSLRSIKAMTLTANPQRCQQEVLVETGQERLAGMPGNAQMYFCGLSLPSLAYTSVKSTFPSSYLVLSLFSACIYALSFAWKGLLFFEARLKCHPFWKISFRSPPWGEEGGLNFPSSVIHGYICSSI